MDDFLDLIQHSSIGQHDDWPPLVVINMVGLLRATLPIFLSFLCFHTFQDGIPSMIWDINSSKMEEPNADEGVNTLRVNHFCSKKVMYNKYYNTQ
jgi:hypothetical protein